MAENRRLAAQLSVLLTTQYRNVEVLLNPDELLDNLNLDFSRILTNGNGFENADLQWYDRRQLINATEVLDLDGVLTNKWGDILNFDAVKILIIRNRETDAGEPGGGDDQTDYKTLEVRFKDELYYVGPGGQRVVYEPGPGGILSIVSSASQEEGSLTVSSNDDVTYDIILIGSANESSEA